MGDNKREREKKMIEVCMNDRTVIWIQRSPTTAFFSESSMTLLYSIHYSYRYSNRPNDSYMYKKKQGRGVDSKEERLDLAVERDNLSKADTIYNTSSHIVAWRQSSNRGMDNIQFAGLAYGFSSFVSRVCRSVSARFGRVF